MPHTFRRTLMALAALGALALGGSQLAGAASTTRSAGSDPAAGHQPGNGETVLTGDALAKVKAAVEKELPGSTVNRASNETDGKSTDAYEAHVTKSDGTRVELFLDSAYNVTATKADTGPRGHGGRHHGRGRGGNGEKVLTGDALAKVKAAVEKELPGSTVNRASNETDGKSTDAYEAHVTKSDGTRVEVLLDSAYNVTAVK